MIHLESLEETRSPGLSFASGNLTYFLGQSAQKSEFAGLINYET
jgi:hypothetical protein